MDVLVSIKSKWWKKIRSGEKTIEVRRNFPTQLKPPFKVVWYETGGVGIVGESICDCIHMSLSHKEYEGIPKGSCLTPEELESYGKGDPLFGWRVIETMAYDTPVPLWIRPPQSWQYLEMGWTSVKDGLPARGVIDPVSNDYIDLICEVALATKKRRIMKYDHDGRWVYLGSDFTSRVIAWMPMPLPYCEKKG